MILHARRHCAPNLCEQSTNQPPAKAWTARLARDAQPKASHDFSIRKQISDWTFRFFYKEAASRTIE
ncbi:MAG: hypothetical protein ACLGQX_01110 [Acidobacteriota bacterium]